MAKYDIFISYRRQGGAQYARIIQLTLQQRGYKVFLDYDELTDGKFGDHIKEAIAVAPIFMIVMSKDALVRCANTDDWVRQEIELAISQHKKIIPVNPDNSFNGLPEGLPDTIMEEISTNQYSDISFGQTLGVTIDYLIDKRIAPCVGKRDSGKVVDSNMEDAEARLRKIDARNRYVKWIATICAIVVVAVVGVTCYMFWQRNKEKEQLLDKKTQLEEQYSAYGLQFSPSASMEQMIAVDRILANMVEVKPDSLWVSQFECTESDWNGILGGACTDGARSVSTEKSLPKCDISYGECLMTFIDSLRNLTNISFDLPSVDEWQYAAKGGATPDGTLYAGSDDVDDVAWYDGNSGGVAHPSDGQQGKGPNMLDLFDMSGNVAEMCNTPFVTPEGAVQWSVCGGNADSPADEVRVESVSGIDADAKSPMVGFRLIIRK